MIKGVLLDYGGTIDSNGKHWGEVIWSVYQQQNLPITKEVFRAAYSFAESTLGKTLLVKPEHNFREVMVIKVQEQFRYLTEQQLMDKNYATKSLLKNIANSCNELAEQSITNAIPILNELKSHFPLVLVSNFYGNLQTVLETFGIKHYFKQIIESAIVGIRKPNPAIFSLGVAALGFNADECVAVGDSFSKDISPAHKAGCKTIWLKDEGWDDDPEDISYADQTINYFKQITAAISFF